MTPKRLITHTQLLSHLACYHLRHIMLWGDFRSSLMTLYAGHHHDGPRHCRPHIHRTHDA